MATSALLAATTENANDTLVVIDPSQGPGITATVVASSISLAAIIGLLFYLASLTIYRRAVRPSHLMGDASVTAYFYSHLLANVFKSASVVMSALWLAMGWRVTAGTYCTAQAALKLVGNVGSSVWSMVIAVHVFNLLFVDLKPIRWALPAVLIGVWSLLIVDMFIGPTAIDTTHFFGPADSMSDGSVCWITASHPTARFLLEYLPTGLSLFVATLLLALTLGYLRGNIFVTGRRIKLRRVTAEDAWHNKNTRDDVDKRVLATVKRMIIFPLAYFALWSPVMVSRLIDLSGKSQPFGFVAFSLTVYALTGAADVILFAFTQRYMAPEGIIAPAYADAEAKAAEFYGDDEKSGGILRTASTGSTHKRTGSAPMPSVPRPLVLPERKRPLSIEGFDFVTVPAPAPAPVAPSDDTSPVMTASPLPTFADPTTYRGAVRASDATGALRLPRNVLGTPSLSRGSSYRGLVSPPASDISMIRSPITPATTRSTNFLSLGTGTSKSKLRPESRASNFLSMAITEDQEAEEYERMLAAYTTLPTAPQKSFWSPSTTPGSVRVGLPSGPASGIKVSKWSASTIGAQGTSKWSPSTTAGLPKTGSSNSATASGGQTSTDLDIATPYTVGAGARTFAARALAPGPVVEPVGPEETYKATMYGARFSLVAGPAPSYNLDRTTGGVRGGR